MKTNENTQWLRAKQTTDRKNCHLEVPGTAIDSLLWPESKEQQIISGIL